MLYPKGVHKGLLNTSFLALVPEQGYHVIFTRLDFSTFNNNN